jgi:hypothetical protein
MITKFVPKNPNKYHCEKCNYYTANKKDYHKHLGTRKHRMITNDNHFVPKNPHFYECMCGKTYKHKSGLSRHKTTCEFDVNNDSSNQTHVNNTSNDDKYQLLSNTIIELVKQNNDFKQLLIEQNKQMIDLASNSGGSNHHNTTNSHNKFNLNVFLNEKCKDAISLTDFVNNMEITMDDFIQTGELGFVDGLSRVMIERINNMELHDRPIHCTDLKRETVYIKDAEKWEKDSNKDKLRKAVKGIAYKNDRMRPIWYQETPDTDVLGSENCEKFLKYSQSALGGCGKDETKLFEDKIMRNVMREVTIDKSLKL